MFIVDRNKDGFISLPAKEIKPEDAKTLSSGLAVRILKLLAAKPMYPIELANELKVHEQKVYYNIRNLEGAGIIRVVKQEGRQGAVAKYYGLDKPSVFVRFRELEETHKLFSPKKGSEFLEPFVKDGQLNALIVVGSPDPHGPEKARSKDGYYGMDLALFLGTFLNYVPKFYVRHNVLKVRSGIQEFTPVVLSLRRTTLPISYRWRWLKIRPCGVPNSTTR